MAEHLRAAGSEEESVPCLDGPGGTVITAPPAALLGLSRVGVPRRWSEANTKPRATKPIAPTEAHKRRGFQESEIELTSRLRW